MKTPHETQTPGERRRLEDDLYRAIAGLHGIEELRRFFLDLTTPAELEAMVDRWAVVGLLKQGVPYREIHDRTGVSVTTIGRVARCLMDGTGGYDLAVDRLGE